MPFLQKIKNIALLGTLIVFTVLLMSGLFHSLVNASLVAPQATNVGGLIDQDTTWTVANSPYLLVDEIVVSAGVTLTVEPGVIVRGETDSQIKVFGILLAIGEPSAPITFTANATIWGGIYFGPSLIPPDPEKGSGRLEHVIISHAYIGVTVSLLQDTDEVVIQNTIIRDSVSYPIYLLSVSFYKLSLSQVNFIDNGKDHIYIDLWGEDIETSITFEPHPGILGYEIVSNLGDLVVREGVTMTVKPGVELLFNENFDLVVEGHLEAVGLPNKPITFTSETRWGGIIFGNPDEPYVEHGNGRLEHVVVSKAFYGVTLFLIDETDEVIIKNSIIRDSEEYGIAMMSSSWHKLTISEIEFIDIGNPHIFVFYYPPGFSTDVTLKSYSGLHGYEFGAGGAYFTVQKGLTLTIEPGVELTFWEDDIGLLVEGNLESIGLPDNPITFTAGIDWNGLIIGSEAEGGNGRFAYTHINNAKTGISVTNPLIGEPSTLSMTHVTLDSNETGLNVVGGQVDGECTAVTNNSNGIIIGAVAEPQLNMQRSLINDNINYGVTNNYPASVDLRFSWWGAANGPSGDGSGSGDALFGDVLYTPWLESPGCDADAVYLLYVPFVIRP